MEVLEIKRAKHREYMARWKALNPDRAKELGRESYARCKERDPAGHAQKRREAFARYKSRDPEKVKHLARERQAEYRQRHPEKPREQYLARSEAQHRRNKDKKLRQRFGITVEQWDEMFEAQGRVCGCCGADKSRSKTGWHTDHCHFTGKVRAILCHHCNTIMSEHLQINITKVVDYLVQHSELST